MLLTPVPWWQNIGTGTGRLAPEQVMLMRESNMFQLKVICQTLCGLVWLKNTKRCWFYFLHFRSQLSYCAVHKGVI